jgi:hypothetical protein
MQASGCSSATSQAATQAVSSKVVNAISSSSSSSSASTPSSPLGAGANPVVIDSVIRERQAADGGSGGSGQSTSSAVDDAFSKVLKQGIAKLSGSNPAPSPENSGGSTESFNDLKKQIEQGLENQQKTSSAKAEDARQQLLLTEVELHH